MNSSAKIAHSRLLYADFIRDESEEGEIIKRIKSFGFTELNQINDPFTKFGTKKIDVFIKELQAVCKFDLELLNYIKNIVFWIHRDDVLPLRVVVVEVILKSDDLQQLEKADLEHKVWKLSGLLGSCFCEGPIPLTNPSKDFHILKFSSRAIPYVVSRNFVAEFVIEAERKFFDNFKKELDSLEKEISIKDLIEQKIMETRDNGKIPARESGKVISKATAQSEQKIKDTRNNIISLEPISFLEGGFSFDQSIVRGYANEMFIVGKIVQGSLGNSTPLYLTVLSMGQSQIPLANLESVPVLQFPGIPGLLDFSFGAGQIVTLQLLNSWNKYVEMSFREVATRQGISQTKTKTDADETLDELRTLIFFRDINEKISINYRWALHGLANSSMKTFLYEFPLPPEENSLYSPNPEQYGLESPGPLMSKFGSHILNSLDLNEKHLSDLIDLRRSKLEVLKIREDRHASKFMLSLTIVIATATIVNVVLFLIRLWI